MTRRFALIAPAILIALTAAAPAKRARPAPPPAPVVLPDTVRVVLTTELGAITIDLDNKHAPITTANFVRYVDAKRFDGSTFYRAMRLEWGTPPNGLVQGGLRGDPTKVFKPIAHEPTSQTGILHKAGTISMARFAPGTATSDFSILLADMPGLDADPKQPGEAGAGFAAFGHVVSGMEVARKIWDAPTSPTEGEGFLKGQMIAKPVKIITVRRVPIPAAAPAPAPASL